MKRQGKPSLQKEISFKEFFKKWIIYKSRRHVERTKSFNDTSLETNAGLI